MAIVLEPSSVQSELNALKKSIDPCKTMFCTDRNGQKHFTLFKFSSCLRIIVVYDSVRQNGSHRSIITYRYDILLVIMHQREIIMITSG